MGEQRSHKPQGGGSNPSLQTNVVRRAVVCCPKSDRTTANGHRTTKQRRWAGAQARFQTSPCGVRYLDRLPCVSGGTGRRTGLRNRRLRAWRFESSLTYYESFRTRPRSELFLPTGSSVGAAGGLVRLLSAARHKVRILPEVPSVVRVSVVRCPKSDSDNGQRTADNRTGQRSSLGRAAVS